MKLGELRGKSVVSVAEAIKLGVVHDALADQSLNSISALMVSAEGRKDQYVVSMDEVRAIGPDVVTVSGQHALVSPSLTRDARSLVPLATLVGCRVVTESGTVLGIVREAQFDSSSGRIETLEYSDDSLQSIFGNRPRIEPRQVVGVGPTVLTVREEPSRSSDPQGRVA